MLILTRKQREVIVFQIPPSKHHREIRISPSEIRHSSVRIGIDAPTDITVLREELAECTEDSPNHSAPNARPSLTAFPTNASGGR